MVDGIQVNSTSICIIFKLTGNISNALAQDSDGFIYALTDFGINKLQFTNNKLEIVWSVPYPTNDVSLARPSGSSSLIALILNRQRKRYIALHHGISRPEEVRDYCRWNGKTECTGKLFK